MAPSDFPVQGTEKQHPHVGVIVLVAKELERGGDRSDRVFVLRASRNAFADGKAASTSVTFRAGENP